MGSHLSDCFILCCVCSLSCSPLGLGVLWRSEFVNTCFMVFKELTEEGLPFFILFHHPDDHSTPERYKSIVAEELTLERSNFFCVSCIVKLNIVLWNVSFMLQIAVEICVDL